MGSPGGIAFSIAAGAALAAQTQAATVTVSNSVGTNSPNTSQWSPPQWSKPLTYLLNVVIPSNGNNGSSFDSSSGILKPNRAANAVNYVFDAVLKARSNSQLSVTSHPIQTGANISDHAYMQPRVIVLDVAMSDAQAAAPTGGNSTANPGNSSSGNTAGNATGYTAWAGNASKSISAYLTLKKIQENRYFCTLQTKYDTYSNCLLESIVSLEDNRTVKGFRGTLTFRQIFTAYVQTTGLSARLNTTDSTNLSTVNTTQPTTTENQNFSTNAYPEIKVPGAGTTSSNGSPTGGVNGAPSTGLTPGFGGS